MKNTLLFTYSTNILLRLLTVNLKNCLTPKNQETVRPHSSNSIWKMLPHHSHSSCENATPFSGTFPLASYKEVQPPRIGHRQEICVLAFFISQIAHANIWLQFQLRVNILTKRENSSSTVMKGYVLSSYRGYFFDSGC